MNFFKRNNKLLKDFGSIVSIDVLSKASGLILLPVYLTLMLPSEYGLFVYASGITTLIASIGALGLYGALNRYFQDTLFSQREVISTLLILLTISVTITLLLFMWSRNFWVKYLFSSLPSDIVVILTTMAMVHVVLEQFLMGFFYIKKSYKVIQAFNITRLIIVNSISLGSLYCFNGDATVERLVALISSELLVSMIFFKYLLRYFSFGEFNKSLALAFVRLGFPLVLNSALGFVYGFADKYFIQSRFGFSSVGEYVFIFSFASLFAMVFSAIQNFWLPFFFDPKNRALVEVALLRLFAGLFVLDVLYFIALFASLKLLFFLNVFHSTYEHGMDYLWLLVLAQFFSSITSLYNNYYALYNKTINGFYVSLIMSVASLAVMYFLISTYHVYGVAMAVLVNSILTLALTCFFVARMKSQYDD